MDRAFLVSFRPLKVHQVRHRRPVANQNPNRAVVADHYSPDSPQ